jgi:hypothetical protein
MNGGSANRANSQGMEFPLAYVATGQVKRLKRKTELSKLPDA